MSKKLHLFNLIAGIIIIGMMIQAIVSGSNNLPYVVILLYVLSYLLQKVNFKGITKFVGLTITILLLIWSLMFLLDFIFPFAP
ncbi:hypothetical protein [Bacillus sp. V59.32b]|uniref:hypothetical protein n=1 Tax=Bacillus sp. V59.32b TaxID=1758642 RepID=UPI000E3D8075|nr:hypothetical protein [Bacillus sp. V59.32b]RFU62215.1 hypothetical protein D0463_13630 [Bacillus sp. V59.32b]